MIRTHTHTCLHACACVLKVFATFFSPKLAAYTSLDADCCVLPKRNAKFIMLSPASQPASLEVSATIKEVPNDD